MTSEFSASGAPVRVAIVGSGPSGFYAAGHLLAAGEGSIEVDLFDRLPTPWGLVRAGVAPDHPKIKSVTRVYEKTAKKPGFRFHGNVEVGRDVTHEELAERFHAVLYAVGAPTDRRLGIPGEDLAGSHPATEFVAWYNGHPDYSGLAYDLTGTRAVVVGNGNVALDVARMLALTPQELAPTDVADHFLEALAASKIEEIVVLGRRGPAQAAYTNPELRELGEMGDADVVVDPADVVLDAASQAFLESDAADTTSRRNVEIVTEYASRALSGKRKRIVLRFLASPVALYGDEHVQGVEIVRNELVQNEDGSLSARPTGETERIDCSLVLRSIGYRGTPIPGVPFDEHRGTIRNTAGRVTDPDTDQPIAGVYTAGWIKRGPSGVIGTNKKDAQETVDLLLEDLAAGRLPTPTQETDGLIARLDASGHEVVDYQGWELIDAHERGLGEPAGRPRVKVVDSPKLIELGRQHRQPS